MKEIVVIMEALRFLLSQNLNHVDPATAIAARGHLSALGALQSDMSDEAEALEAESAGLTAAGSPAIEPSARVDEHAAPVHTPGTPELSA